MLKLAVFAVLNLWLWQNYGKALVDVLEWSSKTGLQHRCLPQCRFAITSSRSIFGKQAEPCCVSQVEFKALISLLPVHRVAEKGPYITQLVRRRLVFFSCLAPQIYLGNKPLVSNNISAVWDEVFPFYWGNKNKARINALYIIFGSLFFLAFLTETTYKLNKITKNEIKNEFLNVFMIIQCVWIIRLHLFAQFTLVSWQREKKRVF